MLSTKQLRRMTARTRRRIRKTSKWGKVDPSLKLRYGAILHELMERQFSAP